MTAFDIVIAGAGIAGASLGWRLAGARSVLLLERESQPGYHATGRSAAMFMETYGPPAARALTRASRDFYAHPPEGFTTVPLMSPRGALYVARPGQRDLLQSTRKALLAGSPSLQTLDAAATLACVGCLRPEAVMAALLDPDAHDLDVHALHQGFLRGLRAAGGALRCDAELVQARHDGSAWTLHLAGGETLRARTLVNAAGAWADALAARCGVAPIGLVPCRRSAFTFEAPPGLDVSAWPVVSDLDETCYFKPDAGRLLGSPANADPVTPHDVVPEELDIATGIHHLEALTTLRIRRPLRTWAGLRSFVPDGELVIGPDPQQPAFFWLAGQGGYGIQTAAGASALADALIRGTALPEALHRSGVEPVAVSPQRLRARS